MGISDATCGGCATCTQPAFATPLDAARQYLKDLLAISEVKAGLYTVGFLKNGMTSRQAERASAAHGVEVFALDRYTLKQPDPKGVLLGFASFDEAAIRQGVLQLAAALDRKTSQTSKHARSQRDRQYQELIRHGVDPLSRFSSSSR